MSLTYKQISYLFDRSFDWLHLPDDVRTRRLEDEMAKIDWNKVPDDAVEINYEDYYVEY